MTDTPPPAPDAESLLIHGPFLRALARSLLHDEEAAEDVVQEAWTRALETPPRQPGSLRAWLATVTRNLARERGRRRSRQRHWERAAARPEGVPSAAEIAEREAVRREVVDAVLAMSPRDREVILLRFYEDLPPRRVAAALGLPVETVRTRIKRATARLRVALDARHGGDRRAWSALLLPLAWPRAARAGAASGALSWVAGHPGIAGAAVLAAGLGLGAWIGAFDPPDAGETPDLAVAAGDDDVTTTRTAAHGGQDIGPDADVPAQPLEPAPRAPAITGVVTAPGGTPVPGARVLVAGVAARGEPAAGDATSAGATARAGPAQDAVPLLSQADPDTLASLWTTRAAAADDEGRFVLEALPPGAWGLATAAHGEHPFALHALLVVGAPAAVAREVADGVERLLARWDDGRSSRDAALPHWVLAAGDSLERDLVLPAAATRSGRLVDGRGRPVPGAEVVALPGEAAALAETALGTDRVLGTLGPYLSRAAAGDAGSFAVAASDGSLLARAEGFAPREHPLDARSATDAAEPLVLVLERVTPVTLAGRVVDATGAPLAGADVFVTPDGRPPVTADVLRARFLEDGRPHTVTGPDGTFTFRELASLGDGTRSGDAPVQGARLSVCALAEGRVPGWHDLRVLAGETRDEIELVLEPGGPLVVEVTDEDGDPVEDLTLRVTPEGGPSLAAHRASGGPFRFRDVPHGPVRVEAFVPGAEPHVETRDARGQVMHVVVPGERVDWSITVDVTTPSGERLTSRWERLDPARRPRLAVLACPASPAGWLAGDDGWLSGLSPSQAGRELADGRFVVSLDRRWPADEAWIVVHATGLPPVVRHVERGTSSLSVALDPAPAETTMASLVLRPRDAATGRPLRWGHATVFTRGSTESVGMLATYTEGEIAGLLSAPRVVDVLVHAPGRASRLLEAVSLVPGATAGPRDVALRPEASLSVRWPRAPGPWTLTVFDEAGRRRGVRNGEPGAVVDLGGLGAGRYTVIAVGERAVGSTAVALADGEHATVTLRPRAVEPVALSLPEDAARALHGGMLRVRDGRGRLVVQRTLEQDDRDALVAGGLPVTLPAGSHRISLGGLGIATHEAEVTTVGGEAPRRVELSPAP